MQRRHFNDSAPLDRRMTEEAQRLRKEARGTPPSVKRDKLIHQARQAEAAPATACVFRPATAQLMPEYRAFFLGDDGHFVGFEPLVCADDSEAIEKAKRLSERRPVELWSGARFVARLSAPQTSADSVTHEVREGPWFRNQRSRLTKQNSPSAVITWQGGWSRLLSFRRKAMWEKCVEIDEKIARYRRLAASIPDQQTIDGLGQLISDLEVAKGQLHPETTVNARH